MKSTLEFNVRLQEFVQLVKAGDRMAAVQHAKKHLATGEQVEVVQQAMGLLAFPTDTHVQPYRDLLDASRWHQLTLQSMFTVALQYGLACLKTPHCYKPPTFLLSSLAGVVGEVRPRTGQHRNPECPVCHPALNSLAVSLPYAHCSQSRLICSISGRPQ